MAIKVCENIGEFTLLYFLTIDEIIDLIKGDCKYIPPFYGFIMNDKSRMEDMDLHSPKRLFNKFKQERFQMDSIRTGFDPATRSLHQPVCI